MARQPAKTKVKAITIIAVKPKPHGMSLKAKPERVPHPTLPGRDMAGRIMPGQSLPGAAAPFTAQTRPMQSAPSAPPLPPVAPSGQGMGNMPAGPVPTGMPYRR